MSSSADFTPRVDRESMAASVSSMGDLARWFRSELGDQANAATIEHWAAEVEALLDAIDTERSRCAYIVAMISMPPLVEPHRAAILDRIRSGWDLCFEPGWDDYEEGTT